jgi:hypothetical protein
LPHSRTSLAHSFRPASAFPWAQALEVTKTTRTIARKTMFISSLLSLIA